MLTFIKNLPQKYFRIVNSMVSTQLNKSIESSHWIFPILSGAQKISDSAGINNSSCCSSEYKIVDRPVQHSVTSSETKHFAFNQRKRKLFQTISRVHLINQNCFYGTKSTSNKVKMVKLEFNQFFFFIIETDSS